MANLASKVIEIATAEIGYLEKETNSGLNSKTGNAGDENYTKYARDLDAIPGFYNGKKNGWPWCAIFTDWVFVQAFGVSEVKRITFHTQMGAGCDYAAKAYQSAGRWYKTPKVGDEIFFKTKTYAYAHTGIVVDVTPSKVITIEGNTSGANGVVYNGGGVCKKSYSINSSNIVGYGRPLYDDEPDIVTPDFSAEIKQFQQWLNKISNAGLVVDGEYGPKTKKAATMELQKYLNANYKTKLVTDGVFGKLTKKACKKCMVKNGSSGYMVYLVQGMLYSHEYECKGFDGIFGAGCDKAVRKFQKDNGLISDGVVGPDTYEALFV